MLGFPWYHPAVPRVSVYYSVFYREWGRLIYCLASSPLSSFRHVCVIHHLSLDGLRACLWGYFVRVCKETRLHWFKSQPCPWFSYELNIADPAKHIEVKNCFIKKYMKIHLKHLFEMTGLLQSINKPSKCYINSLLAKSQKYLQKRSVHSDFPAPYYGKQVFNKKILKWLWHCLLTCLCMSVRVCRLQSVCTRAYIVPCQNNRGKQTLPVLQ